MRFFEIINDFLEVLEAPYSSFDVIGGLLIASKILRVLLSLSRELLGTLGPKCFETCWHLLGNSIIR